MQRFYSVLLLIVSNLFMTFAWYGHLKFGEAKIISNWPPFGVILFLWSITLPEYKNSKIPWTGLSHQKYI